MISKQEAVKRAIASFQEFYGPDPPGFPPFLEAIEPMEDGKAWGITLGFYVNERVPYSDFDLMLERHSSEGQPIEAPPTRYKHRLERKHKLFQIDAGSGELVRLSMVEA